jgi:hypothetical protein
VASANITGWSFIGGEIGALEAGVVSDSWAGGEVVADGDAGGLVGLNEGTVHRCFARVLVTSTGNAGGLVGRSAENSLVLDSYAVSEVFAVDAAGGLIGTGTGGEVLRAYAMSTIATLNGPAGGLISDGAGFSVTDSYYWGAASPTPGTPLSTEAFADEASFVGWPFTSVWKMSPELGRPVLAWE